MANQASRESAAILYCIKFCIATLSFSPPFCYFRFAAVCQDVVVVGAGVAGAYAAWQLRDQGLRVHVYEISNRVGGRLHSKAINTTFCSMLLLL